MANSVLMRQIAVTASLQPLGGNEVFSVDVSCPPTNSGPVFFKVGAEPEAPFIPGEYQNFRRIKLSDITARGNPGDVVSIVGGTWT
jgi:hypothetical protein